ncbi:Uncharacterised protein [Yersinia pseudotuberculosis]|nr:Uncharacterised protein [Yersinia pseudotuberculosis]
MRMTSRKKEILSYYEPDNREWVTGEIGAPPLDVSGVAYMLFGTGHSIIVTMLSLPGERLNQWSRLACWKG